MLSCSCNFDSDDYESFYYNPVDFSTLETSKRKRCVSCGELIDVGAAVVAFDWYRHARDEIEERCKGDEIRMATQYMCEKCGEQYLNLTELGFCVDIRENMLDILKEYQDMTGFKPIRNET